jgi:Zn ribbon nucleic-acid-binding protein
MNLMLCKAIARQYNDNEILTCVNHMIPHNVLSQFKSNNYQDRSFRIILQWFKNDFMKWMPKDLHCNTCKVQMKLQLLPGDSWKVRATEIYECIKCGSKFVFPRYGEIKKIADTRIGRCSEWSVLFGGILNSLSFPTRMVHDYLDHCWNETYIGSKWIHIDSTLEYPISFNHPHYYEQNWNKEYEHVIAFSSNSIEDVTRFYTEKWDTEVLMRRATNKTDRKISMLFKEYLKL